MSTTARMPELDTNACLIWRCCAGAVTRHDTLADRCLLSVLAARCLERSVKTDERGIGRLDGWCLAQSVLSFLLCGETSARRPAGVCL